MGDRASRLSILYLADLDLAKTVRAFPLQIKMQQLPKISWMPMLAMLLVMCCCCQPGGSVEYTTFSFAAQDNGTVTLPNGWAGPVSEGRVAWKGLHGRTAALTVLPGIVAPAEVMEILRLLPVDFDEGKCVCGWIWDTIRWAGWRELMGITIPSDGPSSVGRP